MYQLTTRSLYAPEARRVHVRRQPGLPTAVPRQVGRQLPQISPPQNRGVCWILGAQFPCPCHHHGSGSPIRNGFRQPQLRCLNTGEGSSEASQREDSAACPPLGMDVSMNIANPFLFEYRFPQTSGSPVPHTFEPLQLQRPQQSGNRGGWSVQHRSLVVRR